MPDPENKTAKEILDSKEGIHFEFEGGDSFEKNVLEAMEEYVNPFKQLIADKSAATRFKEQIELLEQAKSKCRKDDDQYDWHQYDEEQGIWKKALKMLEESTLPERKETTKEKLLQLLDDKLKENNISPDSDFQKGYRGGLIDGCDAKLKVGLSAAKLRELKEYISEQITNAKMDEEDWKIKDFTNFKEKLKSLIEAE